jgi:hypothetical protein
MYKNQDLLIFDPNLIIELLQINLYNNYFEFGNFFFRQTTGIAMGAAFSPTIANIFMSVFLKNFLTTIEEKPLLILRYIDDIFILWPKNQNLSNFTTKINNFHPNIKFTTNTSESSMDFLDITIYKGSQFTNVQLLDTKTFQKPENLYQYLHFSSNHPKSTFKSIITGECIRYVRSNSDHQNYIQQSNLFKQRLINRGYPIKFIDKHIKKVNYLNRNNFLNPSKRITPVTISRPIFKCLPPPKFNYLKEIILHRHKSVSKLIKPPIFCALKHKTISNKIVKSKFLPTDEHLLDIYYSCCNTTNTTSTNSSTTPLPIKIRRTPIKIIPCHHPKCATCEHLITTNHFTSTTTRKSYRIRQSYSCNSENIIYLITCSKCKKQYVGSTKNPLKVRINHHRSSIFRKEKRYISVHFNFPDHNIRNLKVQVIDSTTSNELLKLEKYWIDTLKTRIPNGQNFASI